MMERRVSYKFGTFVFFLQPNGFYCLADNDGTAVFLSPSDIRELFEALAEEVGGLPPHLQLPPYLPQS